MIAASVWSTAALHLLPLLKILYDITLLRKGPEDIPYSVRVVFVCVALWLFSALGALALIERFTERDFFLSTFSAMVGLILYGGILVVSRKTARLRQTLSAIIGCGALITLVFVAEYVILTPLIGEASAGLVATLILFWSVPVEGHIIARAIERHWYVGISLAVLVFSLQYVVNVILMAKP